MEFNAGVSIGETDQGAVPPDAFSRLATENARLRLLVGELLLKNQRLRQTVSAERAADENDTAGKTGGWQT